MEHLADFVEQRLAEDELTAWTASPASSGEDGTPPEHLGDAWEVVHATGDVYTVAVRPPPGDPVPPSASKPLGSLSGSWEDVSLLNVMQHVARHHPSRVTAQVAAGRKVLQAFRDAPADTERYNALQLALRAWAVGHAEHPDFDQAWQLSSPDDSSTWP